MAEHHGANSIPSSRPVVCFFDFIHDIINLRETATRLDFDEGCGSALQTNPEEVNFLV